jgi:predicted Zn-dependent protease
MCTRRHRCFHARRLQLLTAVAAPTAPLPEAPSQTQEQRAPVANQREHERILAYNGAYKDEKLERLLN